MRTGDGVELAVVEFGGTGSPIVLLHGLMGRATTWWPVAGRLTRHGRVVAPDARGHGRSQARGPWTGDRMAADVVELLETVGPAVVIGHSMGGLHGLIAASRRPDLVRALVVEDMGVDFVGRDAAATGAWFAAMPQPWPALAAVREAFGGGADGDYMAECVEEREDGWHLLTDVGHAVEIAGEWARVDRWAELAGVACPTLLVEAQASVAPPGQMARMAARMADARHVTLPDSAHLVHVAPGYRPLVEGFLAAVSP